MNEFECTQCGGRVSRLKSSGRTRIFRAGVPPMPIPDDFELHTCSSCGETYVLPEYEVELHASLREAFLRWQSVNFESWVASLETIHSVTRSRIARACGVTPSHLSHVLAGKDLASETLQNLLEAYVASPKEFARRLKGRPLTASEFRTEPVAFGSPSDSHWVKKPSKAGNDNNVVYLSTAIGS